MEQWEAAQAPEPDGRDVVDAVVVARALALLDQGRADEARMLLADALARVDEPGGAAARAGALGRLADDELESAFDDARPETDAMIDADGIAFEAIRRARLDEPEGGLRSPASPFHTRTMADLLERQGDFESADAIRSALGGASASDAHDDLDAAARARIIQTLERWLARLRGGDA